MTQEGWEQNKGGKLSGPAQAAEMHWRKRESPARCPLGRLWHVAGQAVATIPNLLLSFPLVEIAPEGARKIASKARGPTTTGIGGSFQLANSAPPLGVMGCASAPTARISQ